MIRNAAEYNFRNVRRIPILDPDSNRKIKYLDTVTAFDIETTLITKYQQSIMYIWQFQIRKTTVIGRSWDEFKTFIKGINDAVPDGCRIVCYVHNLSYEWQFIKNIIPIDEVFAMDRRKILRVISGKLEIRCSYIHSNMSLDRFLQQMGVRHKKIKGFDYSKKRYPWTRLSDQEILYCINDVRGLQEAICSEMRKDGDDLYTIPLTSTGYARREAREALASSRWWIRMILPDLEVFQILRKVFRGGNTHANRWNANILHEASEEIPIYSYDISSSYPASILENRYPSKFYKGEPDLLWLYLKHDKAILMHIVMYDVRLIDDMFGCPYISKSKCDSITGGEFDNGRVLKAERIECWINEIDFQILLMEYEFEYQLIECWIAKKIRLPEPFRQMIIRMYQQKTSLKGIDDYLYGKSKNRINSVYGMSVTSPVKEDLIFEDGIIKESYDRSLEDLIAEYHKKGWLPYQWGVWITSYSRLKLELGLHAIPYTDFLYCDTDSIKFLGDHRKAFDDLNSKIRNEEMSAVDPSGKRHYLGIWEFDGSYKRFKTLGAKKYCYEDDKGLHVTISGVNKTLGAEELKTIENFKPGFVFRKAGGTESRYNDQTEPIRVKIQGHEVDITSNVAIVPSTYHLSLTVEYDLLLRFLGSTDIRSSLHYER